MPDFKLFELSWYFILFFRYAWGTSDKMGHTQHIATRSV